MDRALPDQAIAPSSQPPQDAVSEARQLARSGKRTEAIRLLQARLSVNPGDLEARTLLGTVLSWEGRYDDARTALIRVLTVQPDYIDALGALAYLELWSGHHEQAEVLTGRVLRRTPRDTGILLARARALDSLNRPKEAVAVLDQLLAVEPTHESGRQMRARIIDDMRHWKVGYSYSTDWFDDNRGVWQEHQVSLGRQQRWGSASVRASQADRFSRVDSQFEIDLYPSLRPGTYFYINAGVAPDGVLYPDYRLGIDWYQSLGNGFEASIGYHRLQFGDGVDIYIGSVSKYIGNWLLISQVFVVPDTIGTSMSYHAGFRRYFGDRQHFGLRYKRGSFSEETREIDDFLVLDSEGASGELVTRLGRRLSLTMRGSWSREERIFGDHVQQYSASASMDFRF